MNLSPHWARKILNFLLRGDALAPPSSLWLQLTSTTPYEGDLGQVTVISGAAKQLTGSEWPPVIAGRQAVYDPDDSDPIIFTMSGTGTIRGALITEGNVTPSSTNVILWSPLYEPYTDGEQKRVPAGTMMLELD